MIKSKKSKTFRPRNYINYTKKGKLYPIINFPLSNMSNSYNLTFSDKSLVGLYSASTVLVYDKEIGSLEKSLKRLTKKVGNYRIFIKPYNAYTSKPSEVRMGKGKGKEEGYLARLVYGQCICMVSDMPFHISYEILKSVSFKLSFKTIITNYSFQL